MNLGVVYNKDNKIINHRSLIKVLINPFLRLIGIQIATKFDPNTQTLGSSVIIRCTKIPFSFKYKLNNGNYIIKKRMIF